MRQIPRGERIGIAFGQGARGQHKHVIKEARGAPRDRGPADFLHLALLGFAIDHDGAGHVVDRAALARVARLVSAS